MAFLSDFQYCFRSSRSTANLLTVSSDRIARAFNRSGATCIVALDISKAFNRVWHVGLLHKHKSYGISGHIFHLICFLSVIDNVRLFWTGSLHKNILLVLKFLKAPFFFPTLFLLHINDLPDDIICNIPIYADDTTLYSKCDQASDLWQQLELASETVNLWTEAGSGLLNWMLEKLNWFCLTSLITLVLLMWKWMGLFLRKIMF